MSTASDQVTDYYIPEQDLEDHLNDSALEFI